MSNSAFPMGSTWRKWDLHIHSPLSMLNNQFPKTNEGPDWDQYLDALERLDDVAVVGVTDYFTIEGYKELRARKERESRLKNISAIFPNIEFRLDTLVSSRKDGENPRRVNLHVLFSDEVRIQDIEENFLHRLDFIYKGSGDRPLPKKSLRISNLESLGNNLKEEFPEEYRNSLPLVVGATNVTVSLEQIVKELSTSDMFDGEYIIVLDTKYADLIKWGGQDTQERTKLLQSCHMVFSSNAKTRYWCLGKSPYVHGEERFIERYNSRKPCIHGSDAHELFYIGYPCANRGQAVHSCQDSADECDLRFCWIKADPTFEGLKQVLYEPEDRVRIQENDPTPSRYNHTLSEVNLSETKINDELTVASASLPLHDSLIAIIGGKGAGKTALVDLIANCFNNKIKADDGNSFVNRISAKSSPDLNISLRFIGAQSFAKQVRDETYVDVADVAYISQGELDKYIIKSADLTNRVNELVFSRVSQVDKYAFDKLTEEIANTEKMISRFSSEIIDLESQISPQMSQNLDSEARTITVQLADLQRQQDAHVVDVQDEDEAQKVQQTLVSLHERRERLTTLKDHFKSANSILDEDISRFNDLVKLINVDFAGIEDNWTPLPELAYTEGETLVELAGRIEDLLSSTLVDIDAKELERDSLSDKASRHAELLDEVREATENLCEVQVRQNQVEEKRGQWQEMEEQLALLYKKMLELFFEKQKTYETIIEYFRGHLASTNSAYSMSSDLVLGDLDFLAEIRFDKDSFLKEVEDLFDNRSTTARDYAIDMVNYFIDFAGGKNHSIDSLAEKIGNAVGSDDLRGKIKPNRSINLEDFYRVFYKNYFNVEPVVLYGQTRVDGLSLGQKATVLIKVYMAQGIYPIIIDSHDDHLDNHFIMEELIPAIREAKKHRQVILVSNNANVVVNADAEQIIVAQHKDNTISYTAGALENPNIRDKALKVLEGGKEAFEKRQKKYRMD